MILEIIKRVRQSIQLADANLDDFNVYLEPGLYAELEARLRPSRHRFTPPFTPLGTEGYELQGLRFYEGGPDIYISIVRR